MKYALLFAALTAFFATAIRADENIAAEEQSQELVQASLAQDILEDLGFRDRPCCERKPDCKPHCRCKPGQILLGRLVDENGKVRQQWKCVEVEQNCKIRCNFWDGFAGFCLSNKQEARPRCEVPLELFNALPSVIKLPYGKSTATQEQLLDLFSKFYLTFGKNGFAYLEETRPNNLCRECCDGRPVCLRRVEFEPFNSLY